MSLIELSHPMSLQQDRLPPQAASAFFYRPQFRQPGPGGMKLEAVMESLQRQQAARLALEEQLKQTNFHRPALVLRHHQGMCSSPETAGGGSRAGVPSPPMADGHSRFSTLGTEDKNRSEGDKLEVSDDEEEEDEDFQHRQSRLRGPALPSHGSTGVPGSSESLCHHEWTYEEQFKQVGPVVDPFNFLFGFQSEKKKHSGPTKSAVVCQVPGKN